MIPEQKKTPEQIAALRQGLGIPDATPEQPGAAEPTAPAAEAPAPPRRQPVHLEPDIINTAPEKIAPPVHLDIPDAPAPAAEVPKKTSHTLRKHELPLAPAPAVTHKTAIPRHRHDPRDIAEIRKREALAKLNQPDIDPALHLRRQTAHPTLYVPGYLLAVGAAVTIYLHFHHFTPLALLLGSLLIVAFIAMKKPRSRHHAALIFIVIFLTAVFGGLHYAPLFQHAP
ncbi:MAG: hypothetical protein ABJQ29_14960 [Luteolibacter sp.]